MRERAPGVPVPSVLAISDDWIITTLAPGRPLTDEDAPRARAELGAAVAAVHEISGPHFGYTGDQPSGQDWPTAFTAIVAAVRHAWLTEQIQAVYHTSNGQRDQCDWYC